MTLDDVDGTLLAKWARSCVREKLGAATPAPPDAEWCEQFVATFVTLRFRTGALQGCIGTIRPTRGILDDVAFNAVAAATRDMRGKRLSLSDVDELDVEISILSPLEEIDGASEAEKWAQVRAGHHGVVLEHEDARGVLLPVVWEKLPTVESFAAALKQKAGLAPSFWHDDVKLWRYTVEHHVDRAPNRDG